MSEMGVWKGVVLRDKKEERRISVESGVKEERRIKGEPDD